MKSQVNDSPVHGNEPGMAKSSRLKALSGVAASVAAVSVLLAGGNVAHAQSASQESTVSKEDIQAKARSIGERVKQDPEFAKQLKQDPRGTLEAAGIPPTAVNEVIGQHKEGARDLVGCVATQGCFLSIKVCCNSGSC
jgi:hypothetical protein